MSEHLEAQLLRAMASARTLTEQAALAAELDRIRAERTASINSDRDVEWADTVVRDTFTPVPTHVFHTAATDWLGAEESPEDPAAVHTAMLAEAASWYARVSPEVKNDREEFAEQAFGMAKKLAGKHADASTARQSFLNYVGYLQAREGASGLDQIQQTTAPDGVTQKSTPLPTEVFDNFAPDVAPENQGADEQVSSDKAPLIQEIMSDSAGMGTPEIPNGHSTGNTDTQHPNLVGGEDTHRDFTHSGSMQTEAAKCSNCNNGNHTGSNGTEGCKGGSCSCSCKSEKTSAFYVPSVALAYTANLDDFRAQRQAEIDAELGESPNFNLGRTASEEMARQIAAEHACQGCHGAGGNAVTGARCSTCMGSGLSQEGVQKLRTITRPHQAGKTKSEKDMLEDGHEAGAGNYHMEENPSGEVKKNSAQKHNMPKKKVKGPKDNTCHHCQGTGDVEGHACDNCDGEGVLKKNAASGLDQIQQTIDPNNTPKTTAIPGDVMFPINENWNNNRPMGGSGAGFDTSGEGNSYHTTTNTDTGFRGSPSTHDNQAPTGEMAYPNYATPGSASSEVPDGHSTTNTDTKFRRGSSLHPLPREAAMGWMGQETDHVCKGCGYPLASGVTEGMKGTMLDPHGWPHHMDNNNQLVQHEPVHKNDYWPDAMEHHGSRKTADMFGGTDMPHQTPNPNIPNSDATVPQTADGSYESGQAAGRQDAKNGEAPTFADGSSHARPFVKGYGEGYEDGFPEQKHDSVPFSMRNMSSKHPEFVKGYKFAQGWTPGSPLVATGSAEFEAGLYEGIRTNAHVETWVAQHRAKAPKFPYLAARLDKARKVTSALKSAMTSTDLDTHSPAGTASPGGNTPLNGPGQSPPLEGGEDPAKSGGPAPYNGAQPMGHSVVPGVDQTPKKSRPGHVDRGHNSDPFREVSHDTKSAKLNPLTMAFRQTVQANLLREKSN